MKKIILIATVLTAFAALQAQDTASSWTSKIFHEVNGNTETWTITDPPLETREIAFADIVFETCDQVTITASNCIMAGGKGFIKQTYTGIDGKTDTLYYGTISIPGITQGFERIRKYNHVPFEITSLPTYTDADGAYLKISFTEEARSSNSFIPRSANQSDNNNNASLTLTITHYPGTKTPAANIKEEYVYYKSKKGGIVNNGTEVGSVEKIEF